MNFFNYNLSNISNNKLNLSSNNLNVINYNFYLFYYKMDYNYFFSKEYLCLSTTDRHYLLQYVNFIKNNINIQMKLFTDLAASDYLGRKKRFNITYNLLSLHYHNRLLINIWNDELNFIDSITKLFPSAQWYEREAWDLFGVGFKGNKDLRRILTDYGFYGHPLRKDFPLTGYVELGYDLRMNSIVYKNITLIQEYREFDTLSPWDFFTNNIPKK
jgi:NADH:ubiquinone oxidoreductase subunit C